MATVLQGAGNKKAALHNNVSLGVDRVITPSKDSNDTRHMSEKRPTQLMWLRPHVRACVIYLCILLLAGCGKVWNNPYPDAGVKSQTLYLGYSSIPNHLDPARSYSANEVRYTANIYEPPLQYHYSLRPYQLVTLTATKMPDPVLLDAQGNPLPDDAPPDKVAASVWTIHIQPGIHYQPHPAFATNDQGEPLYFDLAPAAVAGINSPMDFERLGTRELVAADYVYEIKRLADPSVASPIFSLMASHIKGFREFSDKVREARKRLHARQGEDAFLDLGTIDMAGLKIVDRYTYKIILKDSYPQFRYWLAMPFFAPMPVEALRFYSQPELIHRNITIDTFPVGTGPYMMTVNNANQRIVLKANPNFRGEPYPARGEPKDAEAGLLDDAGKLMPFINRVVYSLERESIPYWNKFLQGYYDISGISSESFDQAINFSGGGQARLTPEMKARGIELHTAVSPSIYYMGFNMLDDVVGGYSKDARKLRRAISIAINYQEYIGIFLNGRGIPAQGPIPPLIFGHQSGSKDFNQYVFNWADGEVVRRPIEEARQLLAEAGYSNGINPETGEPLVLHLDTVGTGPGAGARLDWYRKQLAKLNIRLVIRNTTYNRLQQKMASGNIEMFTLGWIADYPDPENFLFLLYGPNGKVKHGGVNVANYNNDKFDALYSKMRTLPNGPKREAVIEKMIHIVRRDAPWVWGFYPKTYTINHAWLDNRRINAMANNTLKYLQLNAAMRARKRIAWNQPLLWPLALGAVVLVLVIVPAVVSYRRYQRRSPGRDMH